MKNTIKYFAALFAAAALCTTACSDDDIVLDDRLGVIDLIPAPGDPGTLQALLREFWDRYEVIVRYDFPEYEIRWRWTTTWRDYYTPVPANGEQYVKRQLEFVQSRFFDNFTDDFVRRNLKQKIYMVDTLRTNSSPTGGSLVGIQSKDDGLVLGGNAPRMDNFTATNWTTIRNDVEATFIAGLYDAAPIKPVEFEALRRTQLTNTPINDPLGVYVQDSYTFYMVGLVRGRLAGNGDTTYLTPLAPQDFADFILLMIQTPRATLADIMTRFELMRRRILLLEPFLVNTVGLDIVATQNRNVPEDPIPADFFDSFR